MKVLVVGSGGREHAIAREVKKSPLCDELLCAPGNPGMAELGECVPVKADDLDGIVALAKERGIDFVVVGPEGPLVAGLTDRLSEAGVPSYGPSALAARLEGSKAFSKAVMKKYGIPTAAFETFVDLDAALAFVREKGAPIVVKASGLAAGKGAIVCETLAQAEEALTDMLGEKAVFGDSGREVVVEEFMTGEEASLFAVCDGRDYVMLSSAQDHKRVFDGDKGPNTGGMGAYAPAPVVTPEVLEQVKKRIVEPTLEGMVAEGCPYRGTLYVGIMQTEQGPRVVEYNCRFGDPECQVVLPLYKGDVLELLHKAATGRLKELRVEENAGSAAIVVVAAEGYPGSYPKGMEIRGLDRMPENVHAIHAGTASRDGKLVSAGGRVLGIVGRGDDLKQALDRAYAGVAQVEMEKPFFRRDIGQKGLRRLGLN